MRLLLAALLWAAPAAAQDFAPLSPLNGGYAGPVDCGRFKMGFDLSASKKKTDEFVSVRLYLGSRPDDLYAASYVPERVLFEGKITPDKKDGERAIYKVQGRVFLISRLLLGQRVPVEIPKGRLVMGPGQKIELTGAAGPITLEVKGLGEKDRRVLRPDEKGPWRDYKHLRFGVKYKEPGFPLDCSGHFKKSSLYTRADGTWAD